MRYVFVRQDSLARSEFEHEDYCDTLDWWVGKFNAGFQWRYLGIIDPDYGEYPALFDGDPVMEFINLFEDGVLNYHIGESAPFIYDGNSYLDMAEVLKAMGRLVDDDGYEEDEDKEEN